MFLSEFSYLFSTEEKCVDWLTKKGLLFGENNAPDCTRCMRPKMKFVQRKGKKKYADGTFATYPSFKCRNRNCRTYKSVRKCNAFFTFFDKNLNANSKLSIREILYILFLWCLDIPIVQVVELTGHSNHTIVDWYNLCRDIPQRMWNRRNKMGGPGITVQIDESLLRGKRKGNKGRLLKGDKGSSSGLEDKGIKKTIRGPWIFGIAHKLSKGRIEKRFFEVKKRDKVTLHKIIQAEVNIGSTVHSDEWKAYKGLGNVGYVHQSVNHSKNFVDPTTGAHTQLIERSWVELKSKVLRSMRGTTQISRHLVEAWWKGLHPRGTRFEEFITDLKKTFQTTWSQDNPDIHVLTN